jgi:uncharacterized protein (UPF0218 family)
LELKKFSDLKLPFELRQKLKEPLGELYVGEADTNIKRLRAYLMESKPPMFASVGDYVTSNILKACLNPEIAVVDNRIMRHEVDPLHFRREEVNTKNAPGTISAEAQKVLQRAITLNKRIGVVVEGEEDLLVLPLMAMMPLGSVIVYGQPREGMVVVTLTEERRRWAKDFMTMMEKN